MGEVRLQHQTGFGVGGVHGVQVHLHWALLGQLSVVIVFSVPSRKLAELWSIQEGLQHNLTGHLLHQGVPHVLQGGVGKEVVASNLPQCLYSASSNIQILFWLE